jgi:hypothetical protein
VGRPKTYVFRSKYEYSQALRLIEHGIRFTYEEKALTYIDKVVGGLCLACGSETVGKTRTYTPDFYLSDTGIIVETKGRFLSSDRSKMKEICATSGHDIRMVFMADNWLTKRHKMNYSRWCDINGIEYAIGDIPLEWGICNT